LEREWPAWQVPPRALGEWLALTLALQQLEEPPWCEGDPERWFSRRPEDVAEAVAVCRMCPVLGECRAYAVAADERSGTWGGLSEVERRAIAGRRR
jgi:WhiB family redox-sensing transcriptional regulator